MIFLRAIHDLHSQIGNTGLRCISPVFRHRRIKGGDCPKTHKLESANFQFATDDSTFSQLRSCFDSFCRIKQ